MNTKKFLFFLFVLVSAFPGFAADPVSPSDGSETNVVILTQEQYAALTNDIGRLVASMSNTVDFLQFQIDMGVSNTNQLSQIRQSLLSSLGSTSFNYIDFSMNSQGKITLTNRIGNFVEYFSNLAKVLRNLSYQFHFFVSGNKDAAYTPSTYNFVELFKIVDDLRSGLSDLLDDIDSLHLLLRENLTQIASDLSVSRAYIESIRDYMISQLAYITSIMQGGTNQLQTIIHIISNRSDNASTNFLDSSQFDALTNYLDGISDGISNIAPGGGDPSAPGGGGGSTNSVDLSYFDKWLKDWVDRYFYPADSSNVFQLQFGQLIYKEQFMEGVMNFKVPLFYPGPLPTDTYRAIPLEDPKWEHAFFNTREAYNSGHTNYYDIVSALLTDIQSVNAQNYALFYVLATNILLQSADVDVSETQQDVNSLQEKIDSYSSDVETMKTELEYKFTSLKNKYEDIKEKSDQIFSYLGGLARLPQQDYYFDLPKLQLGEDLEFGGMEIILPLTNPSLVMVAEILRFFSICLYWGLFISMLYFAARGVVRMFLLLFKFMLYMGAIGTDK